VVLCFCDLGLTRNNPKCQDSYRVKVNQVALETGAGSTRACTRINPRDGRVCVRDRRASPRAGGVAFETWCVVAATHLLSA